MLINSKTLSLMERLSRKCDKCHWPMIGILQKSGKQAPREVCSSCGGKAKVK